MANTLTITNIQLYKDTWELLQRYNSPDGYWRNTILRPRLLSERNQIKRYLGRPLRFYVWVLAQINPTFNLDLAGNLEPERFLEILNEFYKNSIDRNHLQAEVEKLTKGEIDHPDFISKEDHEKATELDSLPDQEKEEKLDNFVENHVSKQAHIEETPPQEPTPQEPLAQHPEDTQAYLNQYQSSNPPSTPLFPSSTPSSTPQTPSFSTPSETATNPPNTPVLTQHPDDTEDYLNQYREPTPPSPNTPTTPQTPITPNLPTEPHIAPPSISKPQPLINPSERRPFEGVSNLGGKIPKKLPKLPIGAKTGIKKLTSRALSPTNIARAVATGAGTFIGNAIAGSGGALAGGGAGFFLPNIIKSQGGASFILKTGNRLAHGAADVVSGLGNTRASLGANLSSVRRSGGGFVRKRKALLLFMLVFGIALFGLFSNPQNNDKANENIKVTKTGTDSVGNPETGEIIEYRISVTYTGTGVANIEVTDNLPPEVTPITAGEGGTISGNIVRWTLNGVGTNQPKILTLSARPIQPNVWVKNTVEARVLSTSGGGSGSGGTVNPPPEGNDLASLMKGQGRNVNVLGDENTFVSSIIKNGTPYGLQDKESYIRQVYQAAIAKNVNPLAVFVLWGTEQGFKLAGGKEFSCPVKVVSSFTQQAQCAAKTMDSWMGDFERKSVASGGTITMPSEIGRTCIFDDPFLYAMEMYGPVCRKNDSNQHFQPNFVKHYNKLLGR